MARKPTPRVGFTLYDVTYEDGTQRSNRRVPNDLLGGLEADDDIARAAIEEQDRIIAEKSGSAPIRVKKIRRSDDKKRDSKRPLRHMATLKD